jgi:hypothetical protein
MGSLRGVLAVFVVVAGASLWGMVSAAGAASVSLISGESPFAGCSTPAVSDQLFVNAEVEPDVAANPARPRNLIAVWQQDRWGAGGANGIAAGYSFDGGRTWGETPLPFSVCATGGVAYDRASDPAVSFGPDGTAYAIGLSFDLTTPRSAVVAAVSKDGGRSWSGPLPIATDQTGGFDKEWITADPVHAGTAYAVWDNLLVDPTTGHYTGPSLFSKTTDYGQTWSTPVAIAATGADEQSLGNQIRVDRGTGRLYDIYGFYSCTCASIPQVAYVTSDDGGASWSAQHVISAMLPVGVVQPGTGAPVRSGSFPVSAISPTGQVYVAWQDSRFSGGSYDEIAISSTKDGGESWSVPQRVNRPTGRAAFTPSIAVSSSGTVGVAYYDLRRDNIFDAVFSADYWGTTSRDGMHFTGDHHLAGSFDLLTAPFAFGFFVGDYEGLTAIRNDFVAVFAQTNCTTSGCESNPTDIYSAHFGARAGSQASSNLNTASAPSTVAIRNASATTAVLKGARPASTGRHTAR